MNKKILLIIAAMAVVACVQAGPFTPGNLVVTQIGTDGGGALVGAATATYLKEFTLAGSPVQTIALPGTGAGPKLTNSGTATSEGFLTLAAGSLWLGGYNAEIGTQGGVAVGGTGTSTSIPNSGSAIINRMVAKVGLDGAVDLSTQLNDSFNQSNIRAVTASGSNIWACGTNGSGQNLTGGARAFTLGATTATQVSATPTNIRVLNVFNGQLYGSASSSTFLGVFTIGTGLPTGSGEMCTLLPGLPDLTGVGNASVYDFSFAGSNSLYMCDDRSFLNGGGLQKWTFDGSTWTLAYKLTDGLGTVGVRSICRIGGTDSAPTFAVVTGEGPGAATRIMTITDTGALSTFNLVATSGTNTSFRGVEFIPLPDSRSISGNVNLGAGWAGTTANVSITFEVRAVGSTTPLESHTLNLQASGNYSFNTTLAAGTYDITAKGSHWLRKLDGSVTVSASGAANVNFGLVNGDCDGDNEVTLADYSALATAFGSTPSDANWNAEADLDGDEEVTLADYSLLSNNFGQAGDD